MQRSKRETIKGASAGLRSDSLADGRVGTPTSNSWRRITEAVQSRVRIPRAASSCVVLNAGLYWQSEWTGGTEWLLNRQYPATKWTGDQVFGTSVIAPASRRSGACLRQIGCDDLVLITRSV